MPAAAVPDYIHESVRTLPVLPTAVTRLLSLARDINVDFREIARVIETDQTVETSGIRFSYRPAIRALKHGFMGCLGVCVFMCLG